MEKLYTLLTANPDLSPEDVAYDAWYGLAISLDKPYFAEGLFNQEADCVAEGDCFKLSTSELEVTVEENHAGFLTRVKAARDGYFKKIDVSMSKAGYVEGDVLGGLEPQNYVPSRWDNPLFEE